MWLWESSEAHYTKCACDSKQRLIILLVLPLVLYSLEITRFFKLHSILILHFIDTTEKVGLSLWFYDDLFFSPSHLLYFFIYFPIVVSGFRLFRCWVLKCLRRLCFFFFFYFMLWTVNTFLDYNMPIDFMCFFKNFDVIQREMFLVNFKPLLLWILSFML